MMFLSFVVLGKSQYRHARYYWNYDRMRSGNRPEVKQRTSIGGDATDGLELYHLQSQSN
jgi:hypothetical protein